MDKKSWKEKFQDKLKERKDSFSTSSGIDVDRFTINDIDKKTDDKNFYQDNSLLCAGFNLLCRRFWTMRQYAGFGSAKETNNRFKYLLDGQTGLISFDL